MGYDFMWRHWPRYFPHRKDRSTVIKCIALHYIPMNLQTFSNRKYTKLPIPNWCKGERQGWWGLTVQKQDEGISISSLTFYITDHKNMTIVLILCIWGWMKYYSHPIKRIVCCMNRYGCFVVKLDCIFGLYLKIHTKYGVCFLIHLLSQAASVW